MSVAVLDVWNMALGYLGTRGVSSVEAGTPEATQCRLYWDSARRAALRDYPYSFAVRHVLLEPCDLPPFRNDFRYAHTMPDDVLKLVALYPAGGRPYPRIPYTLARGQDGSGQIVLCDKPSVIAVCTFDIEDVEQWDELFLQVMARKLAAMICVPLLKNNSNKLQELESLYRAAVPVSEGQDASEQRERMSVDGWLLARGGWV